MKRWKSAASLLAACVLAVAPTLGAQERGAYAGTPEELEPFRDSGEPYARFFETPPTFRGPGRDEPPPEGLESVVVGVLMPFGGLDRELGLQFRHGVELAIDEANAAGGYDGLPFEPIFRDEAQAWGAAANAAVDLVTEEGAWGLVGAFDDTNSHVLTRVLLKLEVPMVNTSGTDPTLTEHMIPWLVRIRPDDRQNAYRLARRIFLEDGRQRVAVFRANDRYARTGIRELVDAARRLHRPIRLEVRFENHAHQDASDLEIQIGRLRALAPDAIVLWGRAEPSARALLALRAAGIDAPIYGPDRFADPAFLDLAGEAAEGAVLTYPLEPSSSSGWPAFRRRYLAAWNEEPHPAATYAFDGARLLIEAIRSAGLNRVRIRERLYAERQLVGVTGPIRFDATFNNVNPVRLAVVRGGRLEVEDR